MTLSDLCPTFQGSANIQRQITRLIVSRVWSMHWFRFQWPGVTLNLDFNFMGLLCPRPRRGGEGIRRSSASVVRPSVRPSVCLSDVAYIGSNSKTKRPRKTKLCTGVPQVTCDSHTDSKVKRSKVKVTGRRHIVASTNRAATWRTAADITSLKYYLIPQCL